MTNLENNDSEIFEVGEIIPVTPIKEKNFTIKDGVFALVFIVISFVIVKLFFTGDIKTGSVISSGYYHIIIAVMGMLSLFYIGKKPNMSQWVFFGTSMLFCAVPIFSSTALVRFLSWVYAAIMLCIFVYSFSREGDILGKGAVSKIAEAVIATPFQNFTASPKAIGSVLSKGKSKIKIILYILVGLVISIPATLICAVMLASADDNFGNLAGNIMDVLSNDIGSNIIHLLFSLPVAFLLFGYLANAKEMKQAESNQNSSAAIMPAPMVCSAVAPVLICYLLFFFCQLPYFLGAFSGTLPEGYSYSAYARSGFFELCTVCVINFIIIVLANVFSKNNEKGRKHISVRIFLSVLCVATLILITSAMSKMVLYINEMGLTEKRFYTSWFMLALAVVFIIELIREINPAIPAVKLQIAGFSVMLALLCFCDPDARIAQNNVEGYLSGRYEMVDITSMYELSESALPYIIQIPEKDEGVKGSVWQYKESLKYEIDTCLYFPLSIPAVNAQKYL